MDGIVTTLSRVKFVDEGRSVRDELGGVTVAVRGKGGGVPSDDTLFTIGAEVEGEHLAVEVFTDGDFVTSFGVWDGEAVCDFHFRSFTAAEEGADDAAGVLLAAGVVV